MSTRRTTLTALTAAGMLWGTTVPLSKLALEGVGPGWLTVARFALAAPLIALIAVVGRRSPRAALSGPVLVWGAFGYGAVLVLQNAGIARTSVSHAALLVGAAPVLVAVLAAATGRTASTRLAWVGYAVALVGVALVAGRGGGNASLLGDGLVLASVLGMAAFTVAQPRLLAGRDPAAVTAVQFAAATAAALPVALVEGRAPTLAGPGTLLAAAALIVGGTLVPFTLFAYAQARVAPEVAGAFLNLEPVVGVALGVAAFGDPVGAVQLLGGGMVLAGIAMGSGPFTRPSPDRLGRARRPGSSSRSRRNATMRLRQLRERVREFWRTQEQLWAAYGGRHDVSGSDALAAASDRLRWVGDRLYGTVLE